MKLCDSTISGQNIRIKDREEEWTVKIYCDQRILREQIDGISKEAAFLEEIIMASPPGKAYLLERKKTILVNSEIDRICEEFILSCFNKLKRFSFNVVVKNNYSQSDSVKIGTIILNASFTISADNLINFLKMAELIRKNECYPWFCVETAKSQTTEGLIPDSTNNFFR